MILIVLVFFFVPICAMQPFEGEPLLEEDFNQERAELLEVLVEDENLPTAVWDNSRRFYDPASKRKALIKSGKECLKFTALWSGVAVAGGGVVGCVLASILMPTLALLFSLFYGQEHIYWDALPEAILGTTIFGAGIGSLAIHPIATYGVISRIVPIFVHKNPFAAIALKNCLCTRRCGYYLYHEVKKDSVCPELINAANDTTPIYEKRNTIRTWLDHSPKFWNIRKYIIPADRAMYKVLQKITARVENAPPLREEYRRIAFRVKEFLKKRLGRDIVQHLSQFFPQKNILLFMLAHHKSERWDNEYSYRTEKEVLQLMTGTTYPSIYSQLDPYFNVTILAQNGWLAFTPSEKYPIRCQTSFFDRFALPDDSREAYAFQTEYLKPTVYLPYHPDIAHYYKFEEDPHYNKEDQNPSNEKIRTLLAFRQEILAHRIENGNL